MPDSVYKIIEVVGSSPESWENCLICVLQKFAKWTCICTKVKFSTTGLK